MLAQEVVRRVDVVEVEDEKDEELGWKVVRPFDVPFSDAWKLLEPKFELFDFVQVIIVFTKQNNIVATDLSDEDRLLIFRSSRRLRSKDTLPTLILYIWIEDRSHKHITRQPQVQLPLSPTLSHCPLVSSTDSESTDLLHRLNQITLKSSISTIAT